MPISRSLIAAGTPPAEAPSTAVVSPEIVKVRSLFGPDRTRRAVFQRGILLSNHEHTRPEHDIPFDECRRERTRIVRELHDTLLQGFLGASMLLHQAVDQMPADSPSRPTLSRALSLIRRALDEGRAALTGIHAASPAPSSLELAFSNLVEAVLPDSGVQIRIFVQGGSHMLKPVIQEQLFMIGREAVMNALSHSEATTIEIEIEYLRDLVRLSVRDNGRGINSEAVQEVSDSHWGLRGMHDRSETIGAEFSIWSRAGAGTEVRVAVPV